MSRAVEIQWVCQVLRSLLLGCDERMRHQVVSLSEATKEKFTTTQFKQDLALQDKVASWHFADINKANDYDRCGRKAVAHLSGIGRMGQFV